MPFSNRSEDQTQYIYDEARRRVTRLDAEFLAGLEELLDAEPALEEEISHTTAIVTDHLKALVDKLLRLFKAKVIQGQHKFYQSQLERTKTKKLADSCRNLVRRLREDMEAETPSAT